MIWALLAFAALAALFGWVAYNYRAKWISVMRELKDLQCKMEKIAEAYDEAQKAHAAVRTGNPVADFGTSLDGLSKLARRSGADSIFPGVP